MFLLSADACKLGPVVEDAPQRVVAIAPMTESLPALFPEPLADDDDDVAWALQTAKVQWQRGTRADAIVWLRRAADSAESTNNAWRAIDLRRSADELSTKLNSVARPVLGRRPPPLASNRPTLSGPASSPPPRSGLEIDELLGVKEVHSSRYDAPSDEVEVEVSESFEEMVLEDQEDREDQEDQEPRAELVSAELLTDDEHEEIEPEVIEDSALIEVAAEASDLPLPAFPFEPGSSPGTMGYGDADDSITQPALTDPTLHSALNRRSSFISSPPPEPEGEPGLGGLILGEVRGLEDIPPNAQVALVRDAVIEPLDIDEEVRSFALALVLKGVVNIMPAVADLSCARAAKGDIVWAQGHLDEGVALRLVGAEKGTEVAIWDASTIKAAVRDCPWVIDDLKVLADRFQALAGVAMGPLGERLDDSLRGMVTGRCELKRLLPSEELAARGKPVGGMYIVAAGRVEVLDGERVESELGPGEFLFGPQVLSNGAAPRTARAGKGGALLLFAGRSVAHDLLMTVPPLLEIFAS